MGQINTPLNQPFSEATAALPAYFPPTVIGINGRPYLVDTEKGEWKRNGVAVVQQRNTTDARDILMLPQGVWRQQGSDWSSGAGQSVSDREGSITSRFSRSYGINPWERWQMSLLPACSELPVGSLTGSTWLFPYNGYLAVINGQTVRWWNSLGASAAYSTTTPNSGSNVVGISSSGHVLTTLHADGKIYTSPGPTPAASRWYTHSYPSASFVSWAKDYLIVGDRNYLRDITGPSASLIYQHPDAGFRWLDACEGKQAIYAVGYLGDRSTIHRIGIRDDGTALIPAIVAATLPDGEVGKSIDSYLGYVFIGTNKGVRMAQPDSSGDLVLGALIPTSGDVLCFEGQDRFVWFGSPDIDGVHEGTPAEPLGSMFPSSPVAGLGRMDLTRFTTTELTPAWANDLVSSDTGTTIRSVVTFDGKRVFAIDDGGVWMETDALMDAGWLEQGSLSFAVEDIKTSLYQQVKWVPGGEGDVYVDFSYDSDGWLQATHAVVTVDGDSSVSAPLSGQQFIGLDTRIVLLSNTAHDNGPTLTRWEVRCRPAKGRASRWIVPIILRDEQNIMEAEYNRDVVVDYWALMDLVESGVMFTYQENGRSYPVMAVDFEWRFESVSASNKGWQGTFVLVIEEVR